jgi:hypothetical protein
MEILEKIEINKTIRKYEGTNTFLISLKKSLSSKYCKKESVGKKEYKVLSDKQYEAAKGILGVTI